MAQFKISDKIEGNTYTLRIKYIKTDYNIKNFNGQKVIHFNRLYEDSEESEISLPSNDIFIAIPKNSKPKINFSISRSEKIEGIPEFLSSRLNQENRNESNDNSKLSSLIGQKNFEVKGYLWIGNNYCMHLKLFPVSLDPSGKAVNLNTDFTLNLVFQESLPQQVFVKKDNKVSEAICNPEFASSLLSRPVYEIKSDDSWIDYSKDYIKFGAVSDGIYRISYNDLVKYGVNPDEIDARTFQLWKRGQEVPVFVSSQNQLQLDKNGFIEFAGERNMGGKHREVSKPGEPYNEYLGRYTDTSIYWLTWGGRAGERVKISDGSSLPASADTLNYYNEIIHLEVNSWFDFSMADQAKRESPYWYENKTWHEGNLNVGIRNVYFNVTDVYPNKTLKLFTKLQDLGSSVFSKAHLLSLSLNEETQVYDSGYVDKYQQKVLYAELNSNSLKAGSNILKIHSYATSASVNTCILDWKEIEYPRYLRALNNSLRFSFPFLTDNAVKYIHLTNVNTDSLSIWKYGKVLTKYNVSRKGSEIFLKDSVNNTDKFVLADNQGALKPIFFYKKKFINLRNKSNSADYLAITHRLFKSKAEEYCSFISQNYKLKTNIVLVDDIYDEFDYGYFNPECIRDFLKITKSLWIEPTPKYVFLIGDADYDYYRNKEINQGAPKTPNYVPSYGVPVSDNWYVQWDSTGASIPQMNIGRLPVRSNDELNHYLEKHKAYVSRPYDEWNKKYLFFSGGNFSDSTQIAQFRYLNDYIIKNYVYPKPIGGIANHFYKTVNPISNFGPFSQESIKSIIEQGSIFISYIGHSGTQTWDNSITDPTQLNNNNGSPLICDFGCSTAKFAEPDVVSFSELFVNGTSGQAIAYIGNASLGFTSTALSFPQLFFSTILADSVYNISEAFKLAKIKLLQQFGTSGVYSVFSLTSTLISDPVISLPIPRLPNLLINNKDVTFDAKTIDDQTDSARVQVKYYNYGKVTADTLSIKVTDEYSGGLILNKEFRRPVPNYIDSIFVYIPTKDKAGEHKLSIKLDEQNHFNEILKSDNNAEIRFTVSSSSVKPLLAYQIENQTDRLKILNPVINKKKTDSFTLHISQNSNFLNYQTTTVKFDSFSTVIKLDSLTKGRRYWSRALLDGISSFSNLHSFVVSDRVNYSLTDSLSFATSSINGLKYFNNKIYLDTLQNKIRVISAGANDGNTAVIEKNSQNFIPENTLTGHHVCLFDSKTYDFKGYYRFDLSNGGDPAIVNYIKFLDTLTEKYIVAISISDNGTSSDGTIKSAELKTKLKSFGSIYIDSVQFRSSWAMIGKKGAPQGSVPEKFSLKFKGRVEIEQSALNPNGSGSLVTGIIGPAEKWKNLFIQGNIPANSQVNAWIYGIKNDIAADTIGPISLNNKTIDLDFLNSKKYSKIKILTEFKSSPEYISPVLNLLGVNYTGLPELGTNYQGVSISKDSVERGEQVDLNFRVFNAGESQADSFKVKVELLKPDNSRETVFTGNVDNLLPDAKKDFHVVYSTNQSSGSRSFLVTIDPENKIQELYKDNNYFSIPFVIKPDTTRPTLKVSFNGRDIFDGEYVSSKPDIKVELSDRSFLPVTDTTAIRLFLNDKPVSYSSSKELKVTYSASNPKAVVNFTPVLEDGEYTLRVVGKNAAGNFADSAGITRTFQVSNEIRLIDLYNYPNPFNSDTYFTFKLTQIPDEFKIKIYTVAGRMVREIVKNSTDLKFDFNKIYWDGRDQDGDLLANGVYLYKIMMTKDGKTDNYLQKVAIVR